MTGKVDAFYFTLTSIVADDDAMAHMNLSADSSADRLEIVRCGTIITLTVPFICFQILPFSSIIHFFTYIFHDISLTLLFLTLLRSIISSLLVPSFPVWSIISSLEKMRHVRLLKHTPQTTKTVDLLRSHILDIQSLKAKLSFLFVTLKNAESSVLAHYSCSPKRTSWTFKIHCTCLKYFFVTIRVFNVKIDCNSRLFNDCGYTATSGKYANQFLSLHNRYLSFVSFNLYMYLSTYLFILIFTIFSFTITYCLSSLFSRRDESQCVIFVYSSICLLLLSHIIFWSSLRCLLIWEFIVLIVHCFFLVLAHFLLDSFPCMGRHVNHFFLPLILSYYVLFIPSYSGALAMTFDYVIHFYFIKGSFLTMFAVTLLIISSARRHVSFI